MTSVSRRRIANRSGGGREGDGVRTAYENPNHVLPTDETGRILRSGTGRRFDHVLVRLT